MDSDALNTFLMVHHRGGISNAAKALHRTQPAISRRIALLEQELGMPLFERVAGRTVLSDAGRVMVPYAERAVAATQDAENAVRALARPDSGPVALAVVGTLAGHPLARIIKRFAREHPNVNVTLRTATSAEVSELIRRGEATIGLRYHRDPSPDLDCELLFSERLQVVCAPDHRRAGRRVKKLADLRGERWIAFPLVPGQAGDHGLACIRAVPDPRIGRGRMDPGRQPDRAKASGRGWSRHRTAVAEQRRRRAGIRGAENHRASAISRRARMSWR